MFNCDQCQSVFNMKHNLVVHQKTHTGIRFPCTICPTTFKYKSHLNRHQKNLHATLLPVVPIIDQQIRPSVIQFAPPITTQIQIAPQIFVPDVPAGESYTTGENGKRVSTANTVSAARAKKVRIDLVKSPGLNEISSSANRKIVWYYAKNINNEIIYSDFLRPLISELINLLKTHVQHHAIKFNLKLEATCNRPNVTNSSENRAFKTMAVEIFSDSDIRTIVEMAYMKLMKEKDEYSGRGNAVYKYTPIGGSSYIELPAYMDRKRATINPQNVDRYCFKWAILARHVTKPPVYRVGENYRQHEDKYNFDYITFPTPLSDIPKFEKNNINVSINVYGLDKKFQPPRKYPTYEVYPLRVADEEKTDHFDLLLVTDGDNSHYTFISNFSRLIRKQKTGHDGRIVFCKRCFTSFDNQNLKYKLSGQEALDQHKLICGAHKPILPEMSKEGECLQFEAWKKTQRHPTSHNFETILMKTDKDKGHNTRIIHKHEAMSYGLIVKASDEIQAELMEEHEITKEPVIYRGSEIFTDEQRQSHDTCTACNLCKINLTYENYKLQTPNFVPIFFHNLSNYDSHLIVTELGHDTKTINVIPNSEEKYISYSKYISNTFRMRFIDTFRFMVSGLSTLAKNLTTPGLENFRETAKHLVAEDMPLVTRKGVYPYEYTNSWGRLKETCLPRKRDFYSTLTDTGIKETEYEHAQKVWDHFGCSTLGEYSDLYLKVDVLLLADVFENFRDVCMRTYNLDAAHYFTAPGLSFDAMLKFTRQKLHLLQDYDMLLRCTWWFGALSKRYVKANNVKTPCYDETKDKSWIIYKDYNNL
ncbi:hypothetical protein AGLY_002092 [Aphis glycines]|uniref:C2H2-type domain-containing protein n=1 Tax=Aphis glycines TaxID=307491 RepID=A0A6G0U641_APHGL|nr:hypothetical protein AGLY_002092 [Aphis glycines]